MSPRLRHFGMSLTMLVVSWACSIGNPTEPVNPAPPGQTGSRRVSIHGTVRLYTDSATTVSGARLLVRRINAADEQDVPVASSLSDAAGRYGVSFIAACGTPYGMLSDHPHYAIGASASIGPLPLDDCSIQDLTIDLWVQ